MKHDHLFTSRHLIGAECFVHRSRFTRGVLGALDVVGVPGAGALASLLQPIPPTGRTNGAGGRIDLNALLMDPRSAARNAARATLDNPCPGIGSVRGPGGTCIQLGDLFPGGAPAVIPRPEVGTMNGGDLVEVGGEAVIGAFGMPAMTPDIVGAVMDANGNLNPIRRCPAGVLGKDNLCYLKIPNSFRKWPRAARPPVSGSDAKCIRRAASATKRVERLAKSVGLKTKKR